MDYPYKELSYVFVEILNYHSHTDRNLTVNLMEGTVTYFGLKQGNIVNMTNVSMAPYSMTSSEPEKATIVIKDEIEIVKSPSTIFNIMKAFEQRIDEKITNNADITEEEKQRLDLNDYNILILRSNFMIQNMNITSDRFDIFNDVVLFYNVYIQNKTITIKDMHFNVSGTISLAYDPLNMNLMNIDVDYHRNSGGFEQVMFCNYPEAVLDTTVFVDTIHFYYTNDRKVVPVRKQALRSQQTGTFIVKNYLSNMFTVKGEAYGILSVFLSNN